MKVIVHLFSQSHPIVYEKVKNTYTKDGLFCLYMENKTVNKHPLITIFRIVEPYNE